MTNEKKINYNSFFESVAHHNLERFHSETIAWIFNTFPDTAKNFIKSIHTDISSIDKIELNNQYCWAESNQIDILLKYSYDSKNYQIIIENKIKASEHKIEAEKLKKGKNFDDYKQQLSEDEIKFLSKDDDGKVMLSQTEYYYFREKMERAEQIVDYEIKNDKPSFEANPYSILQKYISENVSTIQSSISKKSFKKDCIKFLNEDKNINAEYCSYVYLKPSRVCIDQEYFTNKIKNDLNSVHYYFDKLNAWNKKLGDNPWITITYEELIETIKNNDAINDKQQLKENIIIANAYINFIEDNIKEEVNLDDFNQNEEYARFDYFKLLFALVKTKFKDVSILNSISNDNKENSIYEYIQAGSSNGGIPLFAFYKVINLDEKYTFFSNMKDEVKKQKINIGIQVQGENFKYYVSADDYDNTKVLKIHNNINESDLTNNYEKFVQKILKEISDDTQILNFVKEKVNFTEYKNEGFNPNKTKTFYSRSYKIENFIENVEQPRDIIDIANEISDKVNHFVNFDLSTTIKNFTHKS